MPVLTRTPRAIGVGRGVVGCAIAAVLHRGYAIAQDADGKLLRDADAVAIGDRVDVRLAKGKLRTKVEKSDWTV
jgi:exodeoxyribonuclease VII large subunit